MTARTGSEEKTGVHVWRIAYSGALNLDSLGFGSTLGDGRWHMGSPRSPQIVYAASSRALCQLEKRVHCNGAAPKNMALMRLELPPQLSDIAVCLDAENLGLQPDWRAQQARTQQLGMHWLASKASLGLWVPSFVEPAERNLLINPAHPDYADIKLVIEKNPFVFDPRLF